VLNLATEESDNPDLRDRGFVYWRLLSMDPPDSAAAKAVVLSEKPVISELTSNLESGLLNQLLHHVGSLASVYHKPPNTFVTKLKGIKREYNAPRDDDDDEVGSEEQGGGGGGGGGARTADLVGLGDLMQALPQAGPPQAYAQAPAQQQGGGGSLLGDLSFLQAAPAQLAPQKRVVLAPAQGGGLGIASTWARRQGQIVWDLTLTNQGQVPLSGLAVQFNVNSIGLIPNPSLGAVPVLSPGQTFDIAVPIPATGSKVAGPFSDSLQIAVKTNVGIFYFSDQIFFETILAENGLLEGPAFIQAWSAIPEQLEHMAELNGLQTNPEVIKAKLSQSRVFFVAQRKVDNQDVLYFSGRTDGGVAVLLEVTWAIGSPLQLCVRSQEPSVARYVEATVDRLMRK
jgi:AP-1 complex subunit beta-1